MRCKVLKSLMVVGLLQGSTAWACGESAGSYCINELLVSTSGSPASQAQREYIEIRGVAGDVIPSGTYLVSLEGDANGQNSPGDVDTVINLGGLTLGSNGFLVILPNGSPYVVNTNATVVGAVGGTGFSNLPGSRWTADAGVGNYERPSATYMIVSAAIAPISANDIDLNNDGAPDGAVWAGWTVIDAIGMGDAATDKFYSTTAFRTQGTAAANTILLGSRPAYVARFGDSTLGVASSWTASGTLGGASPNFTFNGTATNVYPAGMINKPLNHLGGSNIWVNAVPSISTTASQTALEDVALVFNAGNGNAITFADSDVGTGTERVTLSVGNGTMNLGSTAGLTNLSGNGTASVQFDGTIAQLNAALNGMSYTTASNFNGSDTLQVGINDLGNTGTDGAKTAAASIAITITAVNDAPSFTVGANQSIANDAGAQTVAGFATSLSAGPSDESTQVLNFLVSNNNNALFATQPSIDATGQLTYTPSQLVLGSATVTVAIHDNGGTANGGVDTSATQTFTITTTAPLTPATITSFDDGDADDLVGLNANLAYAVNFSRNIDGNSVSVTDFTNAGTASISIDSVSTLNNVVTVNITTLGGGTIVLSAAGDIRDVFNVAVTVPAQDDTTVNVDGTAPTITSITRASANPTNVSTVDYTVIFSEAVGSVDAADFGLATTGGIAGASVSTVTGGGTTWTATVNTGSGDGTIGLNVDAGATVTDLVGNAMATSSATGAAYTIDRTGPVTVSVTRVDANPPTLPYMRFTVVFSEAVTGVDLSDFNVLRTPALPDALVLDVTGSGTTYQVLVYGGLVDGTVGLQVNDDDTIVDAVSNPITASFASGEVYNVLQSVLDPMSKDGFENPTF